MSDQLLLDGKYLWEKKSNFLIIIDPGHGGIGPNGYTTAPAKMWKHPDFTIYEGEINRKIADQLIKLLHGFKIDYAVVADDIEDTPLAERVAKADAIYGKDKRAIYLSIHSNSGGGQGFEIFTAPGQSDSDTIAKVFEKYYKITPFKWRGLKEENFYVLRKTDCPAILVENLFFDDLVEAKYLMSEDGQFQIASMMFRAIQELERTVHI